MFPCTDFVTLNMKMAMEGLDWLQLKKSLCFKCLTHYTHDRLTLGSSPYGPNVPRPYRQALCAP